MSVNARVVLLVEDDKTMYTRINEKIDSHITEIQRAFRRSVPFLKDFWEPVSVNVRVVLLVGYDTTMYTRINEKIDSHITEI
jgi:ABC-type cobalt transport system substrate-binding protein